MLSFSDFAISFWLMCVVFCIYWCVNKKAGYFIIASYCITSLINAVVKLTCCIYRPWIRDPNIVPATIGGTSAKNTAGGYSFPSGHTQIISATFGSSAVITWLKRPAVSILLVLFILLVAFSRNYLGVHTPQDVIVGFILGFLSVFLANKLQNRANQDKASDIKLLIYGIIIGIITILYFIYKKYPMDYDANGKLLVDPLRMMRDGFLACGVWLGFVIGSFIEKHFIKFSTDCSDTAKIIRAIIGVASLWFVYYKIGSLFYNEMPTTWARFCQWFLTIIYGLAIYPLIFKYAVKILALETEHLKKEQSVNQ